uniref:Serine/threonine-protein kinase HT1 n=1 Tax=Rhizophora mucronata TaxID=61149 RepID=A0A2P2LSA4_RHIMU
MAGFMRIATHGTFTNAPILLELRNHDPLTIATSVQLMPKTKSQKPSVLIVNFFLFGGERKKRKKTNLLKIHKHISKVHTAVNSYFPDFTCILFSISFPAYILHQSTVIGWEMQHLKRALRTVVRISVSAFSSILTISVKGGRISGLASQQ